MGLPTTMGLYSFIGVAVTSAERELLRQWIVAGAEYEPHWSFVTPRMRPLPTVQRTDWPRNALDRFVLAKLEVERLSPSPEADAATLCRRLHLDLTGLPPTPIMTVAAPSLLAAVAPADVPYRYYVLWDTQGHHKFAVTYAEHLANVADARRRGIL